MFSLGKKKEENHQCIFCGKKTEDTKNALKYEALDENGQRAEYVFGYICGSCADILDKSDDFAYDVVREDGEEPKED